MTLELPTLENMHGIDYQVLRYMIDELLQRPECDIVYDRLCPIPYHVTLHNNSMGGMSFNDNETRDYLAYISDMASYIVERGGLQ